MKLTTKTIASLMVITSIAAAVPGISRVAHPRKKHDSQFDRLLQRHDRKGEIRSELLGMTPQELRRQLRRKSFECIASERGFATQRAFRRALLARLRHELRQRGWTANQMNQYVLLRAQRFA